MVRDKRARVEHQPACSDCNIIKSIPENNIRDVSPKPNPRGAPGYPGYPGNDGDDGAGGASGNDYGGEGGSEGAGGDDYYGDDY